MSVTSKLILVSCCVTSVGIIAYVHLKQHIDREQLHMGVIRDIERQQRRKAENLYRLQQQIEITQEFHKTNTNKLDET